jgi:phosphoglycerate dehydrogenase-like enzyme
VDEEAMIRALDDGHVKNLPSSRSMLISHTFQLSSVGLDVYPDEPRIDQRLLNFSRCTLLPHIGGETAESMRVRELKALGNLRAFALGGVGEDIVPELKGGTGNL